MNRIAPHALRTRATRLLALAALATSAQAHVVFDSPNGGEVLTAGQVVQVEWHVQIYHGTCDWDLEYSTSGPAGPWIPVATDLPEGSTEQGVPHTFDWVVPDTPSTQVRVRVHQDNFGQDYVDVSDADLTIQCAAPPSTYCTAAPNSNGPGASIGHTGTTGVSANDLGLTVSGAASQSFGVFFYGPDQIQQPLGDGSLCVGAGGTGLFRLNPAQLTDAAGDLQRSLDLTQFPADSGPGQITPGSTWHFQFWYRDTAAGGAGFNLSDGLSVGFCG